MIVDLHCHTLPLSTCSSLRAEELVDLARERGLDGICLTEHDRQRTPGELEELSRRTGFTVIGAIELTTDMGHVLAFGMGEPAGSLATGEAAFAHAQDRGGLLYLAHPARDGLLKIDTRTREYIERVKS